MSKLVKEQTRGLFAIAVIAAIISLKDSLHSIILPDGTRLGDAIFFVMAGFWGAYAFLMAIALSPDILRPRFCSWCEIKAKQAFGLGVGFLTFFILLTPLLLLSEYIGAYLRLSWLGGLIGVVIGMIVWWKFVMIRIARQTILGAH